MILRTAASILAVLAGLALSAPCSAQDSSAAWSNAGRLNFDAVSKDPDAYTGKTYVVSARICGVMIRKDGKRAKALQYGARMAYSGMPLVTGSLPLVLDDWYASRAKTPEGRAQVRDLAKFDESMCDVLSMGRDELLLVKVGQFSDTFEPYLSLVDLKDASSSPTRRRSSASPPPAPKAASTPKPASKSAVLAKAEGGVEFSGYFLAHTLAVRANRPDAFKALATALASLKEKLEVEDASGGIVVTKRRKRLLLGLQRQIVAAVESRPHGMSSISLKIVHSEIGGLNGWQPVEDEGYIEKNDKEILQSITQALTNAGLVLETGQWRVN
jgi:hypothetical protein